MKHRLEILRCINVMWDCFSSVCPIDKPEIIQQFTDARSKANVSLSQIAEKDESATQTQVRTQRDKEMN